MAKTSAEYPVSDKTPATDKSPETELELAPYDPTDAQHRARLCTQIKHNFKRLRWARTLRLDLAKIHAGKRYGEMTEVDTRGHDKLEDVLNLLRQAADATLMALSANRPRVLLSTFRPDLTGFANDFEQVINDFLKEIDFQDTLKEVLLEAFFCVGIMKIYHGSHGYVQLDEADLSVDPGRPYCSAVELDYFSYDVAQARWNQVTFAADSYRIDYSVFRQEYDPKDKMEIRPHSKYDWPSRDEDTVGMMTTSYTTDVDEHVPQVDLFDVWRPRDHVVETYVSNGRHIFDTSHPPLNSIEWNPDESPYRLLSLGAVPGNIMASSPALHLVRLHNLINNLMRKQERRAKAQKNIHLYLPGAHREADRVRKAQDETYLATPQFDSFRTVSVGGVDSALQSYILGAVDMFDRGAANLKARAHLGPQSNTLGQDKLIQQGVGEVQANLFTSVLTFLEGSIKTLGDLLWEDQAYSMETTRPAFQGADESITVQWEPGSRQGEFWHYNFTIDPYTIAYQSPGERAQAIMSMIDRIGQLAMSMGAQIDIAALVHEMSKLLNLPRLEQIIQTGAPSIPDHLAGAPKTTGMQPETTRNYVRHNTGGAGQDVQQQALQGMMSAVQGQGGQGGQNGNGSGRPQFG